MRKLIRLPLLLTILIALAIFNIYIAIANEKWYPWLDKNKWTGIEAIVSFILNVSIIYITFYIHRKEREERIAELEKQQKQINEQRREADGDKKALRLMSRIDKIGKHLARTGTLSELCYRKMGNQVLRYYYFFSNVKKPLCKALNCLESYCISDSNIRLFYFMINELGKDIESILDDVDGYIENFGDHDFKDELKLDKAFSDLLEIMFEFIDTDMRNISNGIYGLIRKDNNEKKQQEIKEEILKILAPYILDENNPTLKNARDICRNIYDKYKKLTGKEIWKFGKYWNFESIDIYINNNQES